MSPELNQLIDAALTDGVITHQEHETIMNKARMEGENLGEVEIFLQSRLQKMQMEREKSQPKVRRCPACGEFVPSLSGVCPACGNVMNVNSSQSSDVMLMIDTLQNKMKFLQQNINTKSFGQYKADIEMDLRKAKAFYGENKKVMQLVQQVETDLHEACRKRKIRFFILIGGIVLFLLITILPGVIRDSQEEESSSSIYSTSESYSKPSARAKQEVDSQYKKVMAELDQLPLPNKENYEEVSAKLMRISWEDVPDGGNYEYTKKSSYRNKRVKIANHLKALYQQDGKQNSEIPDDILYPSINY